MPFFVGWFDFAPKHTTPTNQTRGAAATDAAMLVEQPRGPESEYRIVAVNKAGKGQPASTVVAVL